MPENSVCFLVLCLAILTTLTFCSREPEFSNVDLITIQNLSEIPALPARDTYGISTEGIDVIDAEIERNESLYIILRRHDISPRTIHEIQQEAREQVNLKRMKSGQKYRIYKKDGNTFAFVWHRSATDFTVIRLEESILIENGEIPVRTKNSSAGAMISSSLANAVIGEGVSQKLVVELANIYAWQIDFYSLQMGDHFKVLYEDRYVEDEYIGIGEVQAAEFQHRGKVYRAYYYENGSQSGYFDEEGNSVKRALMRVPFEYNPRISSSFSHNRMHPILNRRRPHYGTDYAAPSGTPILAAGDGVVTEAQRRGGNGNIVQIRHNSVYKTAYLHMSRFASGIRAGARVKQGQVIGYVGQTGLATGPHLCYRLYQNGQPVNSVTAEFPASEGLDPDYMDDFLEHVDRLTESLERVSSGESLAMTD